MTERYPWYDLVEGDELEQGDIIEGCPISVATETETADGHWKLQWVPSRLHRAILARQSVGFSRLPICHQLELVVGGSAARRSRLQPTWGMVFRLHHLENRVNLPVAGRSV